MGHAEVVRLLIELKADVNQKNKWGCTPICCLYDRGESTVQIAKMLIRNGADTDIAKTFAVKKVSDIIASVAASEC